MANDQYRTNGKENFSTVYCQQLQKLINYYNCTETKHTSYDVKYSCPLFSLIRMWIGMISRSHKTSEGCTASQRW